MDKKSLSLYGNDPTVQSCVIAVTAPVKCNNHNTYKFVVKIELLFIYHLE